MKILVLASSLFIILGAALAQTPIAIESPKAGRVLDEKRTADPTVKVAELARLGNEIALKSGFSFYFSPDNFTVIDGAAVYKFKKIDGRKITVTAPLPGDHPCGIYTEFPVLASTERSLTLIIGGKPVDVVLDKTFVVDTVELVDSRLRRTLRTWVVPMDHSPVALSPDATKVYVRSEVDDLFIEIDGNGRYRYVAKNAIKMLTKSTDLKMFPKDRNNAYLGYRRFNSGRKAFTLKFSYPCT